VVVGGNAGAIPGVAIRGAEIVIKGNMGSRAGQVMKAGTLCCVGNANFMAGYMMYGGRILILGDSGERVGEDMSGGEIFIAGNVQDLGSDAMLTDIASEEVDSIREFLDRYEIAAPKSFSTVKSSATVHQSVRCAAFRLTRSRACRRIGIQRSKKISP
jgi:formylmethanofuran dehydrogenase subunit C